MNRQLIENVMFQRDLTKVDSKYKFIKGQFQKSFV